LERRKRERFGMRKGSRIFRHRKKKKGVREEKERRNTSESATIKGKCLNQKIQKEKETCPGPSE